MDTSPEAPAKRSCNPAADEEIPVTGRQWSAGWSRWIFPSFWLIYLAQTASGVHTYSEGAAAVLGYVLIGVFVISYLFAITAGWANRIPRFWVAFGLAGAVTIALLPLAHQDALICCVYLAVLAVAANNRLSVGLVVVLTLTTVFVPAAVPSWHQRVDVGDGVIVALVSMAMFGFFRIIQSNIALSEARSEVARLAAENERSRIARDLHDLLGHSLTTITVKAGLARRLADIDPQRAAVEITEVEELSRRALADVRAAVAGYRDVTLTGEIATAREVLRAAGIDATLPGAVDVVDPSRHELFGWVVREGITNVVRHSHAEHCTLTLGPNWLDLVDDGHGGYQSSGSGLSGLRERVEAAGGTVTLGNEALSTGFRLRVDMPPAGRSGRVDSAARPTAAEPTAADPTAADPTAAGPTPQPARLSAARIT